MKTGRNSAFSDPINTTSVVVLAVLIMLFFTVLSEASRRTPSRTASTTPSVLLVPPLAHRDIVPLHPRNPHYPIMSPPPPPNGHPHYRYRTLSAPPPPDPIGVGWLHGPPTMPPMKSWRHTYRATVPSDKVLVVLAPYVNTHGAEAVPCAIQTTYTIF
ncbi:hypothetical protein Sjap_020412 [Stephania japonica]|uniref:Uncharacterized protein n=1 Tax=Stephania japonica TaxID=461633 RepID=A0AAP0F5X5_9MAGN